MDTLTLLQHYWWLIISLLGALLVFLLFVQGGQGLLYDIGKTEEERNMLVNSRGRTWEFTITTLVTFGGAFFASFPLFYSTSFGGAFYVWMAILLVFVIQAVAYEYRRKPGNVFGEKTFNVFLMINGIAGPLLLGTAVGTLFTGANFTVDRLNLANGAGSGSATVISQWTTPWHGLEALTDVSNVFLGIAVTFLAATLACQYFMNNIDDKTIHERARRRMIPAAVCFVLFFVAWLGMLLFADGLARPAQRHLVRRCGYGTDGIGAAALRRMERHGLLPVAGRHAVVADDLQLLIEPLHAQGDVDRLAADPLRRSLHLVRMAGDEPQADHPRGNTRGRPPILNPAGTRNRPNKKPAARIGKRQAAIPTWEQ